MFCHQGSSTIQRAAALCCDDEVPSTLLLKRKKDARERARRITRSKSALSNLSGQFGVAGYGASMFRNQSRSLLQTCCSGPSKDGPDPYNPPISSVWKTATGMAVNPKGNVSRASAASRGGSIEGSSDSRLYNDPPLPKRPGTSTSCAALLKTSWYPDPSQASEYGGRRFPFLPLDKGCSLIQSISQDRKVMAWDSKPRGTQGCARESLRSSVAYSAARVDRGGAASQFGRSGTQRSTPLARTPTSWSRGQVSTNIKIN